MSIFKVISRSIEKKILKNKKQRLVGLTYIKIKYLKHAIGSNTKIHKLLGFNIEYVSGPELLHSLTEIFIDDIYKSDMPADPYIIDCGANIGLSILYCYKFYSNATIDAYEPDDLNFKLLTNNVKQLDSAKIKIFKEAIWINNNYISFESSGTQVSKINTEEDEVEKNITKIKATRLRDLLIKKVALLKMDIEGAEYEVIKDIKDKLHLVTFFFIEYHGNFSNQKEILEILNIVEEAGFNFYIKEAYNTYPHPFYRAKNFTPYDIQLNIFCFRAIS